MDRTLFSVTAKEIDEYSEKYKEELKAREERFICEFNKSIRDPQRIKDMTDAFACGDTYYVFEFTSTLVGSKSIDIIINELAKIGMRNRVSTYAVLSGKIIITINRPEIEFVKYTDHKKSILRN